MTTLQLVVLCKVQTKLQMHNNIYSTTLQHSEQSETAEDSDSWVDVGEVDSSSVTPSPVPMSGTPHEVSHDPSSSTTTVETSPAASVRRYPVRDRRPPDYYS